MTQKSTRYIEGSQTLLQQAQAELERGDLRQASEKAWGAAAQAVKAVGEERGWNHSGHAMLFDIVAQVNDERRRRRISRLFIAANQLHINFYEDLMEEEDVRYGIDTVQALLRWLEEARWIPAPDFVPQTDRQRARLARLTAGR